MGKTNYNACNYCGKATTRQVAVKGVKLLQPLCSDICKAKVEKMLEEQVAARKTTAGLRPGETRRK